MRLVCLLPVRNGADDLPGWFASVERFADAVVALDDGSTDATRTLLESHPLVRVVLTNPSRPDFTGWDDSANRDRLLAAAAELGPEWILFLDVDERLDASDAAALRSFIEADAMPGCAYGFRVARMIGDEDHFDRDDFWVYRLFAYEQSQRMPERKLHFVPVPTSIPRRLWFRTTLRIKHLGGLTEDRRRSRFQKYAEADPVRAFQDGYDNLLESPVVVNTWHPRPPDTPVLLAEAEEDEPVDVEGPLLSAIVISRDDEDKIERCLRSIVTQRSDHPFEVIAVVSGTDRTAEIVRERFPQVRLVKLNRPALPGEARNAGLEVASGEYVSFPGSHVELMEGSIAARIAAHEAGWEMVTGTTYNGTDTLAGWASYFLDHANVLPDRPSGQLAAAPSHCSYMRHLLDLVGRFPSDRRAGEDTVVNAELHRRGFRAYRAREVGVIHHSPCRTTAKLARHHFTRGRAWGRILLERHAASGRLLQRQRTHLLRYVPRRISRTTRNVRRWGGSLRPMYRRSLSLVVVGAVAAWLGTLFELFRPIPRKMLVLLGEGRPEAQSAAVMRRARGPSSVKKGTLRQSRAIRHTAARLIRAAGPVRRAVLRRAAKFAWPRIEAMPTRDDWRLDSTDGQALNVLVIGSDSRREVSRRRDRVRFGQAGGGRADAIVLAHIESGESGCDVISFPRDLPVEVTKDGEPRTTKLGHTYAWGIQLTIDAIRDLTGLPVHHCVVVEMLAFCRMVDAIGGIDITLDKEFYDPMLRFWLPAGANHLDGNDALSFVRSRYVGPGADVARMRRQQDAFRAVLAKLRTRSILGNPWRLRELAGAFAQNVSVDRDFSIEHFAGLAREIGGRLSPDQLRTHVVPLVPHPSTLTLDVERFEALMRPLRPKRSRNETESAPVELRGIYLKAKAVADGRADEIVEAVRRTVVNAVVVDVKNDDGEASSARDSGALLQRLKAAGLYVIGRIVAFQDPLLAERRPDLAIRDNDGHVWRTEKGCAWVDPYSSEVQRYNIAIAEEAARLGFDEIQYDYIRFPTDGPIEEAQYAHADDRSRLEVITGFLAESRKVLAPLGTHLSAALFGYTVFTDHDLGIGQRLDAIAKEVDCISPMLYPSHFNDGLALSVPRPEHDPFATVRLAVASARKRLTGSRARLRPWLQDFSLRVPYSTSEVIAQIKALEDEGVREWLLWNANSRYTLEALTSVALLVPERLHDVQARGAPRRP